MAGEAIFIGYRRDDTADVAGRIYDAMAQRFGKVRVFKDVDNIGPGVDFGEYIRSVLPRCRVALVLIGPHWLDSNDETGKRRLDDDHDWVRIEIETALATPGVLVVPVLVNGARMPRGEEVPDSLKPLDVISFPPGANRRFMNVTKGPKSKHSILMFVIGGDEPKAEFTAESMDELERAGIWPERPKRAKRKR